MIYYFFNKGLLIWNIAKKRWFMQATFSYLRPAATVPITREKVKEIFTMNKLLKAVKNGQKTK